ncbi:MAG: cellulase family glycosylhydrolase [Candidatus Sulfotelmatobacter sp.]
MRKYSPTLLTLLAIIFSSVFAMSQANGNSNSGIVVKITPDTATLQSLGSLQFTALITKTANVRVVWSASAGTISHTGLYHGPKVTSDTAITVKAASVSDPTKFGTASVLITSPQPADTNAADLSSNSSSATIKQSFFGADFNGFGTWPPTDGQHQIATLGGIRLWDDSVKWAQVETSKGVYDWSELDKWMSKAQAQNIDVLYTIGDTPKWAGSVPKGSPCGPAGSYSCSAPTDVKTDGSGSDTYFSDFVTALVQRYKGQIAYYELWNEPDCTCFWSGTTAQIVRMGQDAAAIIRSTDKNAQILSPSAHGPTMKSWFDDYVGAGGAANFDIVNAHLRGTNTTNKDPEAFLTMYDDVTAETQKRNLTKLPVWDDEHGIKKGQLSDTDELAGYVARSIVLRAGVGLQRQYVYTWDQSAPDGLQGNESGTAWDVVAGWLIGHTISPCTASGTVYTCSLDNGLVVWDTAQSCKNGTCTTSKYTYSKTYTKQTDLTGTKTSLSGSTVKIGYKPVFLTAK